MAEDLYGPLPDQAVSMDTTAFDKLVRTHGISFVHYRAVLCPVGSIDPNDVRRPHEDHSGCSNGYLYIPAGEVTCAFSGNRTDRRLLDLGLWNGSVAQVTVPRFYDGSEVEHALFSDGDRLYTKERATSVVGSERFKAHETGVDRMRFPVISVEHLVDSDGESYREKLDFEIEHGRIHWTSTHQPTGKVCAIRYRYVPFWYVASLIHEVRLVKVHNPVSGEAEIRRMPFQLLLQRENVYRGSQKNDELSTNEPMRQAQAPASGSFGAR